MAAKTEKKGAAAMMPNTEEQSKESEALCAVIDDLKAKLSVANLRIEAQNEKIEALTDEARRDPKISATAYVSNEFGYNHCLAGSPEQTVRRSQIGHIPNSPHWENPYM